MDYWHCYRVIGFVDRCVRVQIRDEAVNETEPGIIGNSFVLLGVA